MIHFQLSGIVLLLAIIILNFSHRSILIRTQTFFKDVLYIALLSVVLDACSVVMLHSGRQDSPTLTMIICKVYLISLVFVVYASLMYLISGLDYLYQGMKTYKSAMGFVAMVASGVIALTSIDVSLKNNNLYTYGSSVLITYAVCFFYIFSIIAFLVINRKNLDKRRKTTCIIWITIWLVAAVLQFLFPYMLIVGYASCLGVAVLFVKLENPECFIDLETGLLNQMSLSKYIKERVNQGKQFVTIVITLEDFHKYMELDVVQGAQYSFAKYLDSLAGVTAFHNHGMKYTLLLDNVEESQHILADIQRKLYSDWKFKNKSFRINGRCYVIPSLKMDAEKYEILSSIFVSEKQSNSVNPTSYLDEEWLSEYERKEEYAKIINEAIRDDRVMLYFQPIYDTANRVFHSAEVLVRILSKDGTVLTPDSFIPIAEANDSIIELGELVFSKACEYLSGIDAKKLGIQYLEINVSSVQSTTEDFADRFIAIMEKTGVRPEQINLEITESAALRSKENLIANMEKLIEYGVTFSLDDFGTGFSNLSYILELPVKIVKFDHHMTQAYFGGEKGKLIMEAVIHMVQAVGMQIVAEGVDTKEQVEKLAPEHIDYIQGFYFTKPLPASEYEKFLLENNNITLGSH